MDSVLISILSRLYSVPKCGSAKRKHLGQYSEPTLQTDTPRRCSPGTVIWDDAGTPIRPLR